MASFVSGQIPAIDNTTKGRVLNNIIQRLIDLGLSGIEAKWHFMKVPMLSKVGDWPCGVVSEFRGFVDDGAGVTNQSDTALRYIIAAGRASNLDLQNEAATMMVWDQEIRHAFRKQHPDWLDTVDNVKTVQMTVAEGESFVDEAFRRNVDALFFIVTYTVREGIA